MADVRTKRAFTDGDLFLRHLTPTHVDSNGKLLPTAFDHRLGKDNYLSYTLREGDLLNNETLPEYISYYPLRRGHIGLCEIKHSEFCNDLNPPRPPRYEEVPESNRFSYLHCGTDLMEDFEHRERLAAIARKRPLLIPPVRKN